MFNGKRTAHLTPWLLCTEFQGGHNRGSESHCSGEKQRGPVPREGGLAFVLVGIYEVCRVGFMEVAQEAGKGPMNCSHILHFTELL